MLGFYFDVYERNAVFVFYHLYSTPGVSSYQKAVALRLWCSALLKSTNVNPDGFSAWSIGILDR